MNIFVDTSAFYALADRTDKYHEPSENYYKHNYQTARFITSNFILVETWTLIHHKIGKPAAHIFWEKIKNGIISLHYVNLLDLENAWEVSQRYQDQDYSLVDCTSFSIMERLKIDTTFTFDSHFSIFRTKTNQAFLCQP
jgi:predicted nucleic acid-binding protein